jgi:hypothetical protein
MNATHISKAVAALVVLAGWASAAQAVVVHQYDFSVTNSVVVVEPGWTHMTNTTLGGPTTPGFMPAAGGRNIIDRGSSTQAPFLVTRDLVYSSTDGTTATDIIFRDIIPENAARVNLVIYRSDPADGFAPNFSTSVSINGGAASLIHGGSVIGGTYHAPIAASLIVPIAATGTLDILFSDNSDTFAGDSIIRINGIELSYILVPEPGTMAMLALRIGAMALLRRKRRVN